MLLNWEETQRRNRDYLDFHQVTSTLLRDFENEDIHYALIGGFALGLWGSTRATIDMDFLLLVDDIEKVETILESYGYHSIQKTKNVGQYVADDADFGSIDFIFASRSISRKMLDRSVSVELETGQVVKVLLPEDIIGLKVQALSNDPSREIKDYADIDALLAARAAKGADIDWNILQEYFVLFDRLPSYQKLWNKFSS